LNCCAISGAESTREARRHMRRVKVSERSSRLRILFWLLRRPRLYPEIFRRLRRRLVGKTQPDTREEATRWCEARAVVTDQALRHLTGGAPETPLPERFLQEFERAQSAVSTCPIRMGGPADLELLYQLAEHVRARRVLETGVAYGWSSLALLLSLQNRHDARLVSTDMPYLGRGQEKYVGCAVPEWLRDRWRIISEADREAIPKALAILGQVDLCHYDSDKTVAGRLWAYPRLWRALRPGGFLVSDDVGDNFAFRDFCRACGVNPLVVRLDEESGSAKYIGVLQKSDSSS